MGDPTPVLDYRTPSDRDEIIYPRLTEGLASPYAYGFIAGVAVGILSLVLIHGTTGDQACALPISLLIVCGISGAGAAMLMLLALRVQGFPLMARYSNLPDSSYVKLIGGAVGLIMIVTPELLELSGLNDVFTGWIGIGTGVVGTLYASWLVSPRATQ